MNAPAQTLYTELAEAYRLIAEWQAKHRADFPEHATGVHILVFPHSHVAVNITAWKSGRIAERDSMLIDVEGAEPTIRAAVEAALVGATTVVAECRESWSKP